MLWDLPTAEMLVKKTLLALSKTIDLEDVKLAASIRKRETAMSESHLNHATTGRRKYVFT